jgi:hypothetical protein
VSSLIFRGQAQPRANVNANHHPFLQTWSNIFVSDCTTGFSLLGSDLVSRETSSIFIQDSLFSNTDTAILTFPPVEGAAAGTTTIMLDNVVFTGVNSPIIDTDDNLILPNSVESVDMFMVGYAEFYPNLDTDGYQAGTFFTSERPEVLTTSAG